MANEAVASLYGISHSRYFTDSLARLSGDEQKAAKTAAFDLQVNPAHPSLQLHRLEKAKDHNFWSVRVTGDVRLIVHKTAGSMLLCYVQHHDAAYHWAETRKMVTHPKTGAAQLVELRETVQEILVARYVDAPQATERRPGPFAHIPDSELLGYGVPQEWVQEVKKADEDSILTIAAHLPAEAAEAMLDLAIGVIPKPAEKLSAGADPFTHPDAQRRFRVMRNVEELERALEYPWEKWTVFLHPSQRQLVERNFNGAARVSGSAGTGKTIVALHRAVYLTRANPDARVLLTAFSETLASALHAKLRCLIGNEPKLAERLEVHAMNAIGRRLYEGNVGRQQMASGAVLQELLAESMKALGTGRFSAHLVRTEWEQIVDAWQVESWESYRDVSRLGRKTRLNETQRKALWPVFERVRAGLRKHGAITHAEMFTRLAAKLAEDKNAPFDFVIVDEAQDVSVPQLRLLAALGGKQANGLFLAGDLGQRIFQPPFSWKALGVDVRGRSSTLKINYRTSHQIRTQADRLLGPEISDVDGNREERKGTVSVFNGPPPDVRTLDSAADEVKAAGEWIQQRMAEGAMAHEIGIFVRSEAQLERARRAAKMAGIECKVLDKNVETTMGCASICTMHLAKGLEFRIVVAMACDDEVIPLQARIETVADDAELDEVYNTERHLLYVACTRARDHLLVTGVKPASEFLDDLLG